MIGQRVTGNPSFNGDVNLSTDYRDATPDQQITITNQMKAYIRDHPSEFPAQQKIANTPDIQLTDEYTFGDKVATFSEEFGNQALRVGEGVAGVGNGIVNTLSLAKWVLPLAGLAVAGILVYSFYLKQTSK